MDLLDLLKRPEGKTLEFKRDLSSPDGALRTIVAFANTAHGPLERGSPGSLVVGSCAKSAPGRRIHGDATSGLSEIGNPNTTWCAS